SVMRGDAFLLAGSMPRGEEAVRALSPTPTPTAPFSRSGIFSFSVARRRNFRALSPALGESTVFLGLLLALSIFLNKPPTGVFASARTIGLPPVMDDLLAWPVPGFAALGFFMSSA